MNYGSQNRKFEQISDWTHTVSIFWSYNRDKLARYFNPK